MGVFNKMLDKEEKAKHKLKYYDSASEMLGKCIIADIILFVILSVAVAFVDNCILAYTGLGTIILFFVFIVLYIYTVNQALNNAYCSHCHKLVMDSRGAFCTNRLPDGTTEYFCNHDCYWLYKHPKPKREDIEREIKL